MMTATLAARLDTPPTAVDIDRLAMEFLALESKVDGAYKIASAHAEKSKLLHGITHEILATFGVSTSIDAAAVERFAQALRTAKQTKILNRIFEQTTRYTLRPDAGHIIRAVALPKAQLA